MTRTQLIHSGHLLSIRGLDRETIAFLLDAAEEFLPATVEIGERRQFYSTLLDGRVVCNLFLEDSTRTRGSFTVAAHRLGATTLDITGSGSSVSKGETTLDTARTVNAFGVDAIVIRTGEAGAPAQIARHVHCPVINAGEANIEHPTQGLLDLLVMRNHLGDLAGKRIGIVGDIINSRVAGSNVHGITTLGATAVLVGPKHLLPDLAQYDSIDDAQLVISSDLDAVLPSLDAVMMLRVQFERGSKISDDYHEQFGLSRKRADMLPDHAIIMHPGPMNRGIEIDDDVADDPQRSVILEQVSAGVAIRMAVLADLLVDL